MSDFKRNIMYLEPKSCDSCCSLGSLDGVDQVQSLKAEVVNMLLLCHLEASGQKVLFNEFFYTVWDTFEMEFTTMLYTSLL